MAVLRLVIGNKNYSSWSMRPWLVLRHFGVDFEEIRLPLDTPEFEAQILRYSAARKVPVLVDGETRVWDSLAICEYLAELHAELALWPVDTVARARARSVSAEMHSGFSALRRQLPMNCRASGRSLEFEDGTVKAIERIEAIWTECLEQSGGPFLFGEFSIADAMYAPVVSRFTTYGVDVGGTAVRFMSAIEELPAFGEWNRDAAAETENLPWEEVGLVK